MNPMNDSLQQTVPQPLEPRAEEKTWGLICHLSGFAMYVLPTLGNIIGALVAWLVFKDRSSFADDQGKEALNFQLSTTLYAVLLGVFAIFTLGIGLILAIPLWGALAVFHIVMMLVAAVKTNEGVVYRYPLTIRFIK
jgi:uncharacterized protein